MSNSGQVQKPVKFHIQINVTEKAQIKCKIHIDLSNTMT